MKKIFITFLVLACIHNSTGQALPPGSEIKTGLPSIVPPSPSVAALMKFEEVPVSNYTGIPDVSIPLFSSMTHSKDINIDLSLKYHPNSVAANERASEVGLGWSLFAGGTISRTVRGLPDEINSMLTGSEKIGVYQTATGLNSNDYYHMMDLVLNWFGEPTESPIDENDIPHINEGLWNAHIRGISDTEHDLWQFNFMGQSGRFYIKKNLNNQLEVKPLDDYRIKIINEYGNTQNPYIPTSFTIFDEKGYKYTFEDIEVSTINTLVNTMPSTGASLNTEMGTEYSYRSAFQLSKIEDNNGNLLVEFTYNPTAMEERTWDTANTSYHEDRLRNDNMWSIIDFFILNPCGGFVRNFNPYPLYTDVSTQKKSLTKKIQNINIGGIAKIDFSYALGRDDDNFQNASDCYKLNEIIVKDWNENPVKKIKFRQNYLTTKIKRMSLERVEFSTPGDIVIEKYDLEYKNVLSSYVNPIRINTDYWGYFNLRPDPDIGGFYREVDPKFCTAETLQKMTLPTGGCTIFDFEPNTYSYVGSSELTNFDGNPDNWDKHNVNVFFTPDPINHHVPFSTTANLTSFFTIVDEQDVIFKANIETVSQNNQLQYFFYVHQDGCTSPCIQGSVNFEADDNEKLFLLHLLPGSYSVSFSSPVTGSHNDLIKGSITAYYKNKNSNNYKFLYGGGNRISKIGYFTDGSTSQNYYTDNISGPIEKEKNYEYPLNDGLSSGSLVYNVPDFSYDKLKKECPWCPPSTTSIPGYFQSWKDDQNYFWWYNITTSFNNLNPIKTQGSDVGYKKVKVFETNNGFSLFEYTSPINFPEEIGPINLTPPFLPTENFEYKRGLLTDETHSDNQGRPLIYTHYGYDYENYLVNTGFKTYYNQFEFINIKGNNYFTEYTNRLEYCNQYSSNPQSGSSYPDNLSTCFCYYGRPEEFIEFSIIKEAYGWAKLMEKTTKNYFYPSGSSTPNIVETEEKYKYNSLNKKIRESSVKNSKNELLRTKYFYHNGDAVTRNRISEIERIETFKDSTLLSKSEVFYDNGFSGNTSYLPNFIRTAKDTQSLEKRVEYSMYDEYGHTLQVQQENGTPVSYVWGYNKSQPIAKIENCSYSTITNSLITAVQAASDTGIGVVPALEELRAGIPPGAMITTYTYIPLVGVSTITDPKGYTTTYEYDSFGRLSSVKDAAGNKLSENEYHYGNNIDHNYVKTTTYREPSAANPKYDITYFDGLGRPIEQIAHKQSGTAEDLVTAITYDSCGRQSKEYLPIVSGSTLAYHSVTPTDVDTYYATAQFPTMATTAFPYSEKVFEASPLNRVLEQGSPGDNWEIGAGHSVHFDYQANEDTGKETVKLFGVTTAWNSTDELYDITFTDNGIYDANLLYKTITKNENWQSSDGTTNTTEEFKDKEGRVVLKRTFGVSLVNGSPADELHDTYYVYDDYGNLTYVIPPIVDVTGITTTILDDLCYQYKYDSRNLLVEKKLPGKKWEFIVYNNQDKPVATGPALNPWGFGTHGWMITKYDDFGRVVYTGWSNSIVPDAAGRKTFQDNMGTAWAEKRSSSTVTIDTVPVDYTNDVYPTEFKLLTINYYDDYTNPYAPTPPSTVEGDDVLQTVKGMPVTNWVRVLTAPDDELAEITNTFYDEKGRVISTRKTNHMGGYTNIDSKLDFTGRAKYTISNHKYISSSSNLMVKDMFEYTDQDRLLLHKQKINALAEQLISKNDYDELGQLLSKQVGGLDVTTYVGLQKVDYKYNIRGWLTNINDVGSLVQSGAPEDLFAFKINYNKNDGHVVPELYNGNIAETFWRSSSDNVLRKYSYEYDGLNRLKNAIYQKPNGVGITNMYDEQVDYDKNGNIQHLNRNGDFDADSPSGVLQIDKLEYKYDTSKANQLLRVQDITASTLGFKDDDSNSWAPDDYTYDDFGNMISDTNKAIDTISYNHLNLPVEISFAGSDKIKYLYNATGQKVRKTVTISSNDTVTDYLDGYQYADGTISFFPHAEGYVNVIHCGECLVKYRFNYVFNYLDHLGNIRMGYAVDPEAHDLTLKILEENHYYPFGLRHTNYNAGTKDFQKKEEFPELTEIEEVPFYDLLYKYKFQGQERQDELGLNWDSFKYRNYDYAIGRFMSIDPLAEEFAFNSPYAFQENKLGMGIELEGLELFSPWLGGVLSSSSPITSSPLLGTSDAVKLTTEVGGKSEMHHLIPRAAKGNDVVKAAREEGFKFEGSENKMPVDKFSKATGEGQHGNHPSYNKGVLDKLGEFTKTYEGQSAVEFVRGLVKDLKENIKSNPDKKINDLLKTVAPVKENTAVPLPKVNKIPPASNKIEITVISSEKT